MIHKIVVILPTLQTFILTRKMLEKFKKHFFGYTVKPFLIDTPNIVFCSTLSGATHYATHYRVQFF